MLNILLMIILLIIILIFIFLLLGIRLTVKWLKINDEYDGCVKILILKKLTVYTYNLKSDDNKDDKSGEKDKKRDFKKLYELAKPCFNDFKTFIKSIFDVIKVSKLENHLIFGMDSCADTGKYIGIIWAALAILNPMHEKLHLSAEPSFAGSVLDGHGTNDIEIYPLKLIVPAIRLLSKKDVRKFLRGVWDER